MKAIDLMYDQRVIPFDRYNDECDPLDESNPLDDRISGDICQLKAYLDSLDQETARYREARDSMMRWVTRITYVCKQIEFYLAKYADDNSKEVIDVKGYLKSVQDAMKYWTQIGGD